MQVLKFVVIVTILVQFLKGFLNLSNETGKASWENLTNLDICIFGTQFLVCIILSWVSKLVQIADSNYCTSKYSTILKHIIYVPDWGIRTAIAQGFKMVEQGLNSLILGARPLWP